MKQVLLILSDQKLGKTLKKILTEKFKLEVFLHSSASEAISFLEILPYSNLILVDELIGKENSGQKMFEFINQSRELLPEDLNVIFLSNNLGKYPPVDVISPKSELNQISNLIAFKLKIIDMIPEESIEVLATPIEKSSPNIQTNEATTVFQIPKSGLTASNINIQIMSDDNPHSSPQEYFEIDIRMLNLSGEIIFPCDCYTRVKKGENYEYGKKIEKNSIFTKKDFDKLFNRGIKLLWIDQNDYSKSFPIFTKIFTQNIINLNLSYQERLAITSDAYEIILKMIKENKVDQNLVEMIKATLPSYDFFTKVENPIAQLINELKQNKYSYGLTNSTLTCLLMHSAFASFEWSKDYTKNKINYITFFHDLCIGSDKLIKIHHDFFSEKEHLNPDELALIDKHADSIAKLLEKIVKAPKELVALLREHHGSVNGIGINENLNMRIYPFTKLLIICEKISYEILNTIETSPTKEIDLKDIKDIISQVKPLFEKPGYVEIVKEIDVILQKIEL
jgi:hypothetical protein